MAVKHAVLGLLIEQPAYAGELHRRFNERFRLWRPGSSVHADLSWLRARGMIEALDRTAADQGARAPRVWYEATPEGLAFFESWLRESVTPDAPPLRSVLLMKLGFPIVHDELLVQMYRDAREQEQWCMDRINELAEPGDLEALAQHGKDADQISPLLVREAEGIYLNATIEYLAIVLRELRRVYEQRTGRRLEV